MNHPRFFASKDLEKDARYECLESDFAENESKYHLRGGRLMEAGLNSRPKEA